MTESGSDPLVQHAEARAAKRAGQPTPPPATVRNDRQVLADWDTAANHHGDVLELDDPAAGTWEARRRLPRVGAPIDEAISATPPTVTMGLAAGAGTTLVPATSPRLRVLGGKLVPLKAARYAGMFGSFTVSDPIASGIAAERVPADMASTPTQDLPAFGRVEAPLLAIEFEHDGQTFEVAGLGIGGSRMRVAWDALDGKGWQTEADANWNTRNVAGSGTGGAPVSSKVDFGSRALRRIRVELTATIIAGIRIGPTDGIFAPSWDKGPRVIAVGDSITAGTVVGFGTGAAGAPVSWAVRAAKLLGWRDVWLSGIGSTGWLNPGPAAVNTVQQIQINGTYTAGAYSIKGRKPSDSAYTTSPSIAYNANAATVQTALEAIYGAGNVTVTGGGNGAGGFAVTFVGALAGKVVEVAQFVNAGMTGGTGLGVGITTAGGQKPTFPQRVQNDVVANADEDTVVIWAGGINDGALHNSLGDAAFRTAVRPCLEAVAATGARQVVLGPFTRNDADAVNPEFVGMRDSLKAIAAAVGADFIDTLGAGDAPWITGTGKVGTTTGNGNADAYVSSDATHRSLAGTLYEGRRAAAELLRLYRR